MIETHSQPVQQVVRGEAKIGRNEPCPCDSGEKYKKCCGAQIATLTNGTRREIYLRAHTEKVRESEKPKKPNKGDNIIQPERYPERCLILDTEVRTEMDGKHGYQALTVGFYRICVLVNGEYKCEREGVFYSGENEKGAKVLKHAASAVLDNEELNTIGQFILSELPDVEVPSFPPRVRLEVHQTFTAFMEKVFWHVCGEAGLSCV